ncbi:MAG: MFS transporter [Lonepinella koalarum]|nr:MFS transporter [Lonepinella koalarum]
MQQNSPIKVATASMVGTAIEYFDNYIYTMAAVLIFNTQFFNSTDPMSNQLASIATLALAIFARPLGAALFGHLGDKFGRKRALVTSLLLMGFSTIAIGLLPSYASFGIGATLLLCLCRIGQGIALGGEWAGAALVATENAPKNQRGWFGIFPQLGAPIGLLLANGAFFLTTFTFGQQAFLEWAWRIPFIASVILVAIGLYIRLNLHESAVFLKAESEGKIKHLPSKAVFTEYFRPFSLGVLLATAGYVLFYILIAFAQVYAKSPTTISEFGHPQGLGLESSVFTRLLLINSVIFGVSIAFSGIGIQIIGRRLWMLIFTALTALFGLCLPLFLTHGTETSLFWFLAIGMILIGATFGPLSILLPELFPTEARYSGAALSYTIAGVLGGSVATIVAIQLNTHYGIFGVGLYLTASALLSCIALWFVKETKHVDL